MKVEEQKVEEQKNQESSGEQVNPDNQGNQEINVNQTQSTDKKEEKMFVHEIYDRLPFTYKGVDRFVKIMIGITIAILIFAVLTSK